MKYAVYALLITAATLVPACSNSEHSVPPLVNAFAVEGAAGEIPRPAVEIAYQAPPVGQPISAKRKVIVHKVAGKKAQCEAVKPCSCPAHKELVAMALPGEGESLVTEPGRIPAMNFSTTTLTKPGTPIIEYGVTGGFPAMVNLSITSWGTKDMPWLFKASGMYLGNLAQGIQLESGWAFYRTDQVRQYIGVEFITLEWNPNVGVFNHTFSRFSATGIGPSYGITAFGVTAQVGVYYGHYRLNYQGWMDGFNVSAQLGWANLW
ncbi:MAG: hypothetical protein HYZ71_12890 [Deltaproteobacteria bacterium]|nr:hypothetical protein [Deltaproteobacteria bacterium]